MNLIHSIDGYSNNDYKGILYDEKTFASTSYLANQRAEWIGYNTLTSFLPSDPLICDERLFQYKDKSPPNPLVESCISNLNKLLNIININKQN